MSDIDEPPPSKVTKIELATAPDDTIGSQDNGQEEWLSEGVLTDDGFDAGEAEPTASIADNTSQDDSAMLSANEMTADTTHLGQSMEQDITQDVTRQEDSTPDPTEQTVEETLRQLSETQPTGARAQLDSISEYLVKKPRASEGEDGKMRDEEEEEDGNNTDELLQMLGDDKPKKKMQVLKTPSERRAAAALREAASSNDDDEESMEAMVMKGARVTRLRVAQNALRKYPPKKAQPEALSDSEMSTDEAETVKNMFKMGKVTLTPINTSKKSEPAPNPKSLLRPGVTMTSTNKKATPAKTGPRKPLTTSTPLKQYGNRSATAKSVPGKELTVKSIKKEIPKTEPLKKTEVKAPKDVFEVDEESSDEHGSQSHQSQSHRSQSQPQRLMQPESMDDDMLSEEDSELDDDDCNLYNELPSSESEDIEEWFALDVRAERAGDYIPLLGHKAFELLTEEKKRVEIKLGSLRSSITELGQHSKLQSSQIEEERRTLAELDTLLAHT